MMKVLTAHIPLDLAGEVDALADRLDRSRAWIVKQALEEYIGRQSRPGGFAEAPARFGVPDVTTQQGEIDMNARDHSRQEGTKTQAADAHAALLALRATTTLGDIPWAELRDAGRA